MTYRVLLADEARRKIHAQAAYIAEEGGSPVNAGRWLSRVLDASGTLESMPRRCPPAIEDAFFPFEVRALYIDRFVLLFTVDDEAGEVRVLNARYGRQLPLRDEH